jgi:hypothetical protein
MENNKKYVFIATHDNRLQCFFSKLFYDNKIKTNIKRFKNCAIIHIKCQNGFITFNMVYDGDIDITIEKEGLFYKQEEFNDLSRQVCYRIYDKSNNYDNIEIFLIRHGKGIHNIDMKKRKKMGAKDAFKYAFKSKKMNTEHELIDAELTNSDDKTSTKLNGISNAIKAGSSLNKYLETFICIYIIVTNR